MDVTIIRICGREVHAQSFDFCELNFFRSMPRRKKTLGIGAIASCYARLVHPSKHVRDRYPNMHKMKRLEGLTVVRWEKMKIQRKDQECIVFTSDEFVAEDGSRIELYACKRYLKVEAEGLREDFFIGDGHQNDVQEEEAVEEVPLPVEIVERLHRERVDFPEDISALRGTVEMDHDNDPAPENIPTPIGDGNDCNYLPWGHSGTCSR